MIYFRQAISCNGIFMAQSWPSQGPVLAESLPFQGQVFHQSTANSMSSQAKSNYDLVLNNQSWQSHYLGVNNFSPHEPYSWSNVRRLQPNLSSYCLTQLKSCLVFLSISLVRLFSFHFSITQYPQQDASLYFLPIQKPRM